MASCRTVGLLVVAFICPPIAVIIARDRFDSHFWLNLLLTLLAWLPGWLHATWVVLERPREAEDAYLYEDREALTRPLAKDLPPGAV